MTRYRSPRSAAALAALLAAVLPLAAAGPAAAAGGDQAQKVRAAAEVWKELMETPDKAAPEELVERAKCVALFPSVIKGAVGWGGRHGNGVLTCRQGGDWSPPIFVNISGGSFGFQIGGSSTDLVLFFLTERGVRSLLDSKFTLGGDATVAAGPLGRSAEASTDLKLKAEIYSYAKSRGLFAGVSLEGARLAAKQEWIKKYYGRRAWPDEILFEGKAPSLPPEVAVLRAALP